MIYKVIDSGEIYSHYYDKAIELDANVNKNKPECHDYPNYKWEYGQSVLNGDKCKVLCKIDYHGSNICLIERIKDSRQFVIGERGIKEMKYLLEDNLFEI